MMHAILLCCMILADDGKPAEATAEDRAAYEAAAAKAGKYSAAQIQLALWCEAHGFTAERSKHLDMAISLDPSNALARGLFGQVAFQGKWAKPEQVKHDLDDDPKFHVLIRQYLERRVRTPQKSVDAQLRLAAWCLENGLKDEALAHYHVVTSLDHSRDIAWLRLGYKKHHNRWVKPDDLAAQKLEADRQKHADREWKPRLEKLRDALESSVETRRLKAENELYHITDPHAVPAIWRTFVRGSEKLELVAVELFTQIEGPGASFCLLVLAIDNPSSEVRARAAQAPAHRDPRDLIGWMINRLHKPFKYEVRPGANPGSPGTLFVDGERFDLQRFYRVSELDVRLIPQMPVWLRGTKYDAPSFMLDPKQATELFTEAGAIEAASVRTQSAILAQATVANLLQVGEMQRVVYDDARAIEAVNARIDETNARLLPILESLTGQKLGVNPDAWRNWWADQLGYVNYDRDSDSKISFSDVVSAPDLTVLLPIVSVNVQLHHACFAAGTVVQTLNGPRNIESIAVGDRVLSQHTTTGVLSFQPVLATHLTGPAETFRISLAGETIVATGIHRFWKAGKGWTMARDLKAGDRLRMLGVVATIDSIERGATQMVYNLNVALNRDFLVGSAGLLVHDYGFVFPVSEPFDRVTNAAPIASK
jgi:Pretoxin HINT domain